jgi:hypothetical protein
LPGFPGAKVPSVFRPLFRVMCCALFVMPRPGQRRSPIWDASIEVLYYHI